VFTAPPAIKLRESHLQNLREDSDAVREMLKIEDSGEQGEIGGRYGGQSLPVEGGSERPPKPACGRRGLERGGRLPPPLPTPYSLLPTHKKPSKTALNNFLKGLSKVEREALKIIATWEKSAAAIELLARKHHTMPALLIDSVNAAFMALSGDLLIDTVDTEPLIQSEYKETVKTLLERT
jgi:hypothetical protein